MRGQPKYLSKLGKLYVEPLATCHPHKNPLFHVKEESGVEHKDDFLIPIVPEVQKVGDTMDVTSFNYSIENGFLLLPHVVKMNLLHRDNRLGFLVEHSSIPILVKESLEVLISALFLGLGVASNLA
jgi:hypothetical protein